MTDVVQSIRQALQDFVAPELREHRVLLTALDSKIDLLGAELRSEFRAELNPVKSDVGVLKTDVGVLKTDVAALKTDVAGLKTDMGVLKIDMATLKTTVQSGFEKLQHGLEVAVLPGGASTARELADCEAG